MKITTKITDKIVGKIPIFLPIIAILSTTTAFAGQGGNRREIHGLATTGREEGGEPALLPRWKGLLRYPGAPSLRRPEQ